MKELEAMKAVYSYFFPESRLIVNQVEGLIKDTLFLTQTPVEKACELLLPLNFKPELDLPSKNGLIDLDNIHIPIIDRIMSAYSLPIPALANFEFRYPTAGSTEGLFHKLNLLRFQGYNSFYILEGEYEGYQEYGKTIGLNAQVVTPEEASPEKLSQLTPGFWFISNPSAREGNIIDNQFINSLCEMGHHVAMDLSYVGSTTPYTFDVSHPNIDSVFLSFSKPYGLFWRRIGFTFSREPITSLYANKWFKNPQSLLIALKIAEEIGPTGIYPQHHTSQLKAIEEINGNFNLGIIPSDVLLLGYTPVGEMATEHLALVENYRRGPNFRFCLTPYLEKLEGNLSKSS